MGGFSLSGPPPPLLLLCCCTSCLFLLTYWWRNCSHQEWGRIWRKAPGEGQTWMMKISKWTLQIWPKATAGIWATSSTEPSSIVVQDRWGTYATFLSRQRPSWPHAHTHRTGRPYYDMEWSGKKEKEKWRARRSLEEKPLGGTTTNVSPLNWRT